MLNQVGPEGQKKLKAASVIVVGAGGLGSPALTYLAAAGVGRLGLIDSDTVSLSNLNRQFLFSGGDIGRSKAASAKEKLTALNGDIEVIAYEEHLSDENAGTLFAGYDLVLGAVDSFDTRFVINRAAAALKLPYIDGGVNGFSGCVVFSQPPKTPCLACVFPIPNAEKEPSDAPSDSPSGVPSDVYKTPVSVHGTSAGEAPIGVLGTTAGVIGTLEANLCLLWLLGHQNPLENKLLLYDGFRMSMDLIEIRRDKNCSVCGGA